MQSDFSRRWGPESSELACARSATFPPSTLPLLGHLPLFTRIKYSQLVATHLPLSVWKKNLKFTMKYWLQQQHLPHLQPKPGGLLPFFASALLLIGLPPSLTCIINSSIPLLLRCPNPPTIAEDCDDDAEDDDDDDDGHCRHARWQLDDDHVDCLSAT